jgi:glycerophosphoryl diester phosphodiesterase
LLFAMSLILHPGPALVIGHRGAAAVRPENTLPSFQYAMELGVDAVEFDVRVTGDGVAVVHHDPTTLRTCGVDLSIARSSIGALRRLDASETFSGDFRPRRRTPIPLLDEVLDLTRSVPVIIECKTVDAAPLVLRALAAHGARDRALVASFVSGAMRLVRAASMPSGASRRDIVSLLLRSAVRFAPRRLPFSAMCLPEMSSGIRLPIARFAAWGRAIGVPVHIWTVNSADDAIRLWDSGVTGIISDDPETILAARETHRRL